VLQSEDVVDSRPHKVTQLSEGRKEGGWFVRILDRRTIG
jgi:hypothetical protein